MTKYEALDAVEKAIDIAYNKGKQKNMDKINELNEKLIIKLEEKKELIELGELAIKDSPLPSIDKTYEIYFAEGFYAFAHEKGKSKKSPIFDTLLEYIGEFTCDKKTLDFILNSITKTAKWFNKQNSEKINNVKKKLVEKYYK